MILVQNFNLKMEVLENMSFIIGADMSSSVHINNEGKETLILGEGSTQGLHDTTLRAEAIYPINFTQPNKRFVLSL